jgi:hypothetical protein
MVENLNPAVLQLLVLLQLVGDQLDGQLEQALVVFLA